MLNKLKILLALAFLFFTQQGFLWGQTINPNQNKQSSNLILQEAIDSIEVKIKSEEKLKPFIVILLNSGTQEQIVTELKKILLEAKLPLNRTYAGYLLFRKVWENKKDKRIAPIFKEALNDSLMEIRLQMLWYLHRMGEKIPMDLVEKIARGEGKDRWAVTVLPQLKGAKPKSREELIEEARDNIQISAIKLLYEIKGKDVAEILWDMLQKMPYSKAWDYASKLYKEVGPPPKKVEIKDFGPGPWTPEQIREYERERVEGYRKMYAVDLLGHLKWLEQNYKNKHIIERVFRDLEDARDLRAIPLLIKVLKYNPRGINRANAAQSIKLIEKYNHDKSAISALVEALNDTITDVKEKVADALVALGDTTYSLKVLEKLAKGEDKEHWTVDWAGYMGLENMTEKEIKEEKKRFRDNLQVNAVDLLGKIGTKRAVNILKEVKESNSEEWVRKHAKDVLEKVMERNGKRQRGEKK